MICWVVLLQVRLCMAMPAHLGPLLNSRHRASCAAPGGPVAAPSVPQQAQQPEVRRVTIAFYANGIFTVDDGGPGPGADGVGGGLWLGGGLQTADFHSWGWGQRAAAFRSRSSLSRHALQMNAGMQFAAMRGFVCAGFEATSCVMHSEAAAGSTQSAGSWCRPGARTCRQPLPDSAVAAAAVPAAAGEPRDVRDPANAPFMQAIMEGRCPPELDPGSPDIAVGADWEREEGWLFGWLVGWVGACLLAFVCVPLEWLFALWLAFLSALRGWCGGGAPSRCSAMPLGAETVLGGECCVLVRPQAHLLHSAGAEAHHGTPPHPHPLFHTPQTPQEERFSLSVIHSSQPWPPAAGRQPGAQGRGVQGARQAQGGGLCRHRAAAGGR